MNSTLFMLTLLPRPWAQRPNKQGPRTGESKAPERTAGRCLHCAVLGRNDFCMHTRVLRGCGAVPIPQGMACATRNAPKPGARAGVIAGPGVWGIYIYKCIILCRGLGPSCRVEYMQFMHTYSNLGANPDLSILDDEVIWIRSWHGPSYCLTNLLHLLIALLRNIYNFGLPTTPLVYISLGD